MMKPPKSIMTTFLVLLFAGHVHLNSVNIQPERATGIVGQEAHINCEVEFGITYEMNWDFNKKFVYIFTNEVEEYPVGKSKYSVQRAGKNFTLVIKNLNLEDGGKYICSSFTSAATAFLLVLDTPSITLYPPKPIEGQVVEVTCEARFGGPREDLILPNHFPNLMMYLNGSSLDEMHIAETNNNVKEYHLITLNKNFTVHANMNTRQITCESGTAEPLTNISGTTVMNVLYSVRNIYVTPKQEIFDVGDHITCIADSNPEAVYDWKKVQGGSIIFGNQLNITATMIGENNWECVARNVINGEWFEEIVQAHFVAVDPSKSGNERSPVTTAVVTVIIIIIILAIIGAVAFKFRKIPKLGPLECIQLLKSAWEKHDLDQHGKDILRVLKEERTSILENCPDILIVLIKKVGDLIDSEYYEDIIKVVQYGGDDSPLKHLLGILTIEENFKKLFKVQKKLMSVIRIISSYGDVQYRTEIQGDIDTLLQLYDGMKRITNPLLSPDDAIQKALQFSKRLARLERSPDLESDSCLLQAASSLSLFTVNLIESLKNQHFSEDLSQTYITILIVFFTNLMPRPFSYHHRKHLRLDLRDKRLNQGKCMNVEPDLSVYYHCFAFLVGEVKKHRVSGKKQEEKNSDGKEPQPGKSDDSGEPLAKRCKPNLDGNADSRDENYIMQKLNVDTEGVRTKQDNTCGDDASNAEKLNSKYYRHLRQEEEIQVCRYLPQLFAEMLAATAVNNPNVWIGRTNEAVQLGFGLDGFKLRFVRLVLRNCGDDERRPTIADIRNPKVRCDIFLTKEFDLFNQSHLKMFFQMLFAFTYVNDVRPHPR